jgi:hypothetical protein
MPRHRGTTEGTASLIGRLLILISKGKETSSTLAGQLGVSPRQVNRYILGLIQAGWQIERVGAWTRGAYWFELRSPEVVLNTQGKRKKQRQRMQGKN